MLRGEQGCLPVSMRFHFWGDEQILELVVMILQRDDGLNTIELCNWEDLLLWHLAYC